MGRSLPPAKDDRAAQDSYAERLRGLFKSISFTPEAVAGYIVAHQGKGYFVCEPPTTASTNPEGDWEKRLRS